MRSWHRAISLTTPSSSGSGASRCIGVLVQPSSKPDQLVAKLREIYNSFSLPRRADLGRVYRELTFYYERVTSLLKLRASLSTTLPRLAARAEAASDEESTRKVCSS